MYTKCPVYGGEKSKKDDSLEKFSATVFHELASECDYTTGNAPDGAERDDGVYLFYVM